MQDKSTTPNSPAQSISRTGFIAAVALRSGRVLGAYRENETATDFQITYVDDTSFDGIPDPITICAEDAEQIVRLLADANVVLNGEG